MTWVVLYENVTNGGIVFANHHSKILELPAECEILSAYLVWRGESEDSVPTLATKEGIFRIQSQGSHEGFHFAEVTAMVRKLGRGPYPMEKEWTLCVAYQSFAQPMRKLVILLPGGEGEGTLISGFFTPNYGPLEGKLYVGVHREKGKWNEPLAFQGRRMEWNFHDPTPYWQAISLDLSRFLLNAQSSCTLRGTGISHNFSAHLIGMQIKIHAPFFVVNHEIEPTLLHVGEVVACKLTILNQGTSENEDLEIELNLPEELELDPEGFQGGEWVNGKVSLGKVLPGKSKQVVFTARLIKKPNLPDLKWRPAIRFSVQSYDSRLLTNPLGVRVANRPPIALPLQVRVREKEEFSGCVKGLDFDGDPLFYSLIQKPQHGFLKFSDDGQFVYFPEEKYYGEDRFVYAVKDSSGGTCEGTVWIRIYPLLSSIPSEIVVETKENESIEVPLPFHAYFSCKCLEGPLYGTVVWQEEGKFVYTPRRNYIGEDGLILLWRDAYGETAYTRVKVQIERQPKSPVLLPQTFSTYQTTSVEASLKVIHDLPCTFEVKLPPVNGTMELREDGTFCYTPHSQFFGKDSFIVKVSDGAGGIAETEYWVEVTELPNSSVAGIELQTKQNQPGSGILPGDYTQVEYAPQNGTLEIRENREFVYTPFAAFTGEDFCILSCCRRSGVKDYLVIRISVYPVTSPVILDQTFTAISGLPFSGRIYAMHPQNKPLLFELVEPASYGTVILKEDGRFVYQSDLAFVGEDAFTIRIGEDLKRIPIQVVAREGEAWTKELFYQVEEGTTLKSTISLTAPVRGTFTLISEPRYGEIDLQDDGTFTYVPRSTGRGRDVFAYQVTTEGGQKAVGTVEFHLLPAKKKSITKEEFSWFTYKNVPLHQKLPILLNSSSALCFELKESPVNGTVTLEEDGAFTYIPAHDSVGKDSFVVQINGEKEIAVSIEIKEIKEVEEKRKRKDLSLQTPKNMPAMGQVWEKDGKAEIQWQLSQAPLFGEAMVDPDGSFTYVPSQDFFGNDYFAIEGIYEDGSTEIVVVKMEVIPQEEKVLAFASKIETAEEPEQNFEELILVEEEKPEPLELTFQYEIKEKKGKIQRKLPLPAGYQFAILHQPKFGRAEIFPDGRFLYRKTKQRKAKADEFLVKASKTEDLVIRVRIHFK